MKQQAQLIDEQRTIKELLEKQEEMLKEKQVYIFVIVIYLVFKK